MQLNLTVLNHTYLASHKIDIGNGADPDQTPQNMASDQGLHSLLTGNYIRNRIKMIQDTWQPLNDKWTRVIAKVCIFIRKYGLIVSLCKTASRVLFSSF